MIIQISKGYPDNDIRQLLNSNVIGTPGRSLVYQHQRVNAKLQSIIEPIFLAVKIGGKTIGACCLVKRDLSVGSQVVESYYIRYFSFRQSFRSKADPVMRLGKRSALKDQIGEVLSGKHIGARNHSLFYAYVDPGNVRSSRIIESFGLKEVGRFRTVFFSRLKPRYNGEVSVLHGKALQLFLPKLINSYEDHSLFTHANIGFEDGYMVMKKDGEIVAGLQANSEYWKVFEIPGARWLIHAVSRLPMLNKVFHTDFRFLSIEGIYLKAGHEHLLASLIESALKLKQRNTAIFCLDPRSPHYSLVRSLDRGMIRFLTSEKELSVVAKGNGVRTKGLAQRPIYVSGFDNM